MNKVSIYGGLGNQMFQYALCIALNQKGKKTKISFSDFLYRYHHNGFNLTKAFNLDLPFPLRALGFFLLNSEFLYKNKVARYFTRSLLQNRKKRLTAYHEKKEFEYDKEVFSQDSCFFVGIWQVEEYFREYKFLLRREFKFRLPKDRENKRVIDKINNSDAISIHIRRGDYLSKNWEKTHAVITETTYYNHAIEYIRKFVKDPHFFIFSDDMEWAKENLKLENCSFVDHNKGKNSYIDMYLMSLCKHNIIANSTFSWWGAWLNKNDNKIVVMPDKWKLDDCCPGIFPQEWIKLSVHE